MDTSHLFNTQHARLAPPSLAQQQGFQPGLSQVVGNFFFLLLLIYMDFKTANGSRQELGLKTKSEVIPVIAISYWYIQVISTASLL